MLVRYKKSLKERETHRFNIHSLCEILTGDDSACMSDFEIFVNGAWKDMSQAFRDRDVIPDNYNETFGIPRDEASKARGYNG